MNLSLSTLIIPLIREAEKSVQALESSSRSLGKEFRNEFPEKGTEALRRPRRAIRKENAL